MHPILFEFGKLRIYSYGVMVALGFLIALYFAAREAKRAGIAPEKMFDIGLQAILFGIISARALHVFVNLSYYAASPLDIIMINKGGLAFHGGLFGGILAVWYYIKRNKMNLWKTADVIIPYVALGQSIGRIGCLLNGCCYGTPTQLPIGISFPGRLLPLHPTQVYSSVFLFLMFIVLKRLYPVRDIR
ncbi:MAG: prolipoprotein diacylglyceryl transferase, partial [Candidatus Omnitrophota bacterium]|nr:prolipoprotein diacylglyceryl transferase [Candidatus Omnitrophota bacterium]